MEPQTLAAGLALILLVLAFACVLVFGLGAVGPLFPECGACKEPMPAGYWCRHDGAHLCSRCGKARGLAPWYEKRRQ